MAFSVSNVLILHLFLFRQGYAFCCSRKICFCIPGTPAPLLSPRGRESFLQDVLDLENLLAKPAFLAAGGEETVEVLVPRLAKDLKAKKAKSMTGQTGGESGEDTPISLSKKAVMRKKATMAAIAVAEAAALAEQAKKAAEAARLGAARQLTEAGAAPNGIAEGATCEICFYSEVIGSKRADRMVPCPNCKKLFHRNCLKRWAGNRDLFNWSSWVCGSCRICEVCRRMGEPNKLMFCKRCDGAFHAYCQQPPLKHVPKGPFLCPKHTVCHSCASRVPGSGVSSRWFLEYTTCDSCGRLFIKGKYCSICLKVYRDSEASPMVCCDNCEHWVHAHCDGISDEKYHEFQLDNNLHYTCAACRGDSHRVRDMDDAADELWRRRDEADRDLIRQYQAAAGVPSKDENLKLCPSDDEDDYKVLENRLMKKAVKVLPLKGKDRDGKPSKKFEFGKHKTEEMEKPGTSGTIKKLKITLPKSHMSKSKGDHHNTEERRLGVMEERGHHNASFPQKIHKKKNSSVVKLTKYMIQARESIAAGNGKITLADQNAAGAYTNAKSTTLVFDEKNMLNRMKNKHAAEQIASPFENKGALENPVKTVKFVNNANDKAVTNAFLPLPVKEKGIDKTVMKIRPVLATMREDKLEARRQSHQFHSDEEGSEGTSDSLQEGGYGFQSPYLDDDGVALHQNMEAHTWGVYGDNVRARRRPSVKYRDKDSNVQKPAKSFEDMYEDEESDSNDTSSGKQGASSILAKRMQMDATSGMSPDEDSSGSPRKRLKSYLSGNLEEEELANKDSVSKVSFKLKLKQPMSDNDVVLRNAERESSPKHGNGNALRGQRSKRKKHHSLETGKPAAHEQEAESHVKEEGGKLSDDNWILQKLGRDAVGKRVEVFRLRDRSWCKGKVTEVSVLQSQFTVSFDDGRLETIEFGKRSVRLLSHLGKHLRS